jgi:hypothetical protein
MYLHNVIFTVTKGKSQLLAKKQTNTLQKATENY